MNARHFTRRHFLGLGMTTVAGAILASCQPKAAPTPTAAPAAPKQAEPTSPPAKAPQAEKKVEFWGATGGAFAEDLLKRLEEVKASGRIFVDYIVIPGGWPGVTEKLNAAVAAKSVPDLVGIKDFMTWEYAWRGAVLSLDDYFAKGDYDVAKFRKSIWDAMFYEGKSYGAPWPGSFVHVLGINDELFEKAGLDLTKDIPKNWDQLVEVSGKMTDLKADPQHFGHMFYELSTREYMLMLLSVYVGQLGGKVFSDDRTKVTLDTPEANQAMQWMYDMLWTWKYAVPVELHDNRWDLFYSGVVGSANMGPWQIWSIRKNAPQLKLSIHKWPCNKTCDNVDAAECLVIMKDAKDPDLSWDGIKVLLNPEWDLELGIPRGCLPVFAENLDKGGYVSDPPFKVYAEIGRDPELRPRAWVEGYEEIASVITPELQAIWFNKKGVKEGLAAAEKAGNEAIQRFREKMKEMKK